MTGRQAGRQQVKRVTHFHDRHRLPCQHGLIHDAGPSQQQHVTGQSLVFLGPCCNSQRRQTVTLHAHTLLHTHQASLITHNIHTHTHRTHTHVSPIHITHQASLIRHNIHTHTCIPHTHHAPGFTNQTLHTHTHTHTHMYPSYTSRTRLH